MKRKSNIGKIIWFLLLLIGGFVFAYFNASMIRAVLVRVSDIKRVENRLYVDPHLAEDKLKSLEADILEAKSRVLELYGGCLADPAIIAGDNVKMLSKFGMTKGGTGVSHITMIGSYIVLGPNGMNVDVIAHEMCHCELAKRVGMLNREKIPAWFDEGLAMQLDDREKYGEEEWVKLTGYGKSVPDIKLVNTSERFYNSQAASHYIIAKHELKQWLAAVGTNGLSELVLKIKKGREFGEAYFVSRKRMGK
jgi:hypothetical protein